MNKSFVIITVSHTFKKIIYSEYMIIKSTFSNGQQYPVLLDKKSIPNYLSLRYVITHLRGKSFRTKYISVKSYSLLQEYFRKQINLSIDTLIINFNNFKILYRSFVFKSSLRIISASHMSYTVIRQK